MPFDMAAQVQIDRLLEELCGAVDRRDMAAMRQSQPSENMASLKNVDDLNEALQALLQGPLQRAGLRYRDMTAWELVARLRRDGFLPPSGST